LGTYFTEKQKSQSVEAFKENTAVAVESAVNEVLLVGDEVLAHEENILALESIAVSLEAFAETAEASKADGGLDRTGAVLLQQAVQTQTDRLGMVGQLVPSQESFGGTGERLQNTEIAVEGIKEVVKDIWDAIVKAIKAAMLKIKEWWNKLNNSLPGIKKRAEELQERAESTEGSIDKDKITVGGDADRIKVKGSADNMVSNLGDLKTLAMAVAKSVSGSNTKAVEAVAKGAENVKLSDADVSAAADQMTMLLNAVVEEGNVAKSVFKDERYKGEGMVYKASDEFMGGKIVVCGMAKEPGTGIDGLKKTTSSLMIQLASATKEDKSVSDKDISKVSKDDVVKACDVVISICDELENFSKNYAKVEKAKDMLITAGNKLVSGLDDDASTEVKKLTKAYQNALNKAAALVDQPGVSFVGNAASAMRASLNVCEKSLAQYKTA
jgi:hypothetical protein